MPLQLPDLDDRIYTDLVEEALGMIPTYAGEDWTDHNPSDPGITLIELFAYLTEMLLYRLNQVTDDQVSTFLKLLNGPGWQAERSLDEEIRRTVRKLAQPDRAITAKDFENLARQAAPEDIARVHCVPGRNLAVNPHQARPGHVSIIVIPKILSDASVKKKEVKAKAIRVKRKVRNFLEPRRLLTTRIHVVDPRYVKVRVQLTLIPKHDYPTAMVRNQAVSRLQRFLDPLQGGPDGKGWPFGRNVYVSDIYQLLNKQAGVEAVTRTGDQDELMAEAERRLRNEHGQLVGVKLEAHELVDPLGEDDINLDVRPNFSLA